MNTRIRRINIWGGPGSGKSTNAAKLFSDIKQYMIQREDRLSVELVREFVKEYAWSGNSISGFDQVVIMGEQLRREYQMLRDDRVDMIVTDSPLMLGAMYADMNGADCSTDLVEIALGFELNYPSINIVMNREDRPYDGKGRYQDKDGAVEIDRIIKDWVPPNNSYFMNQDECIFDVVKNILNWD